MSTFNRDFKPRRAKKRPQWSFAIFFACLLIVLTVLIVAELPDAIDHCFGIGS